MCYNAICCSVFSSCSSLWVTALRCSFRSTCCLRFHYFNRLWRLPLNPVVHSSAAVDVVKEWNKSARFVFHLVAKVTNVTGVEDHLSMHNCCFCLWLSKNGISVGIFLFFYFCESFKSCCGDHTYEKGSDGSLPVLEWWTHDSSLAMCV